MNNFYLARAIRVCAVSNYGSVYLLFDKVLVINVFIL